MMSPVQRCFSDLVCQPLVTSYVIDAYLCLAMLHAWILEYQHDALRLMLDTYEGRKPMASWRRLLGRPHNVWLNNAQQDANTTIVYAVEICIHRGHRVVQWSNWIMRWMMVIRSQLFQDIVCQNRLLVQVASS